MYVLLIMLIFGSPEQPEYRSPNVLPIFFSQEACEAAMEEMTDTIKRQTGAKHVVYTCSRAIPVNAPPA